MNVNLGDTVAVFDGFGDAKAIAICGDLIELDDGRTIRRADVYAVRHELADGRLVDELYDGRTLPVTD